jgi:hypothetical protein
MCIIASRNTAARTSRQTFLMTRFYVFHAQYQPKRWLSICRSSVPICWQMGRMRPRIKVSTSNLVRRVSAGVGPGGRVFKTPYPTNSRPDRLKPSGASSCICGGLSDGRTHLILRESSVGGINVLSSQLASASSLTSRPFVRRVDVRASGH